MRKLIINIVDFVLFDLGDFIHNHPDLLTVMFVAVGAALGVMLGSKLGELFLRTLQGG